MAAKKKAGDADLSPVVDNDTMVKDLIDSLNKDAQHRVAYNLSVDQSPTHVKRWISTGSRGLDYVIANMTGGGLPEGRIVEIFGDDPTQGFPPELLFRHYGMILVGITKRGMRQVPLIFQSPYNGRQGIEVRPGFFVKFHQLFDEHRTFLPEKSHDFFFFGSKCFHIRFNWLLQRTKTFS
jgi:hypothetical protein